ncbi:MAG: PIN domain-containing protein [Dermatophilaceae bacterium]
MAEHPLAVLDTSCVIAPPPNLAEIADTAAVSTLTVAELAYGLHTSDPVRAALRERRYREVLATFDPLPYSAGAAHWYGAIAASVRAAGRNPRPRRIDLMLASVAADIGAVLLTRNGEDFAGTADVVHVIDIATV